MKNKYLLLLYLIMNYVVLFSQNETAQKDSIAFIISEITNENGEDVLLKRTEQCEFIHLNWIILMDGKFPNFMRQRGEFVCETASPSEKRIINFNYLVGEIIISKNDYEFIIGNDVIKVLMILHYDSYNDKTDNGVTYSYPFKVYKSLFNSSYVIFNILNINMKKKVFYVTHECTEHIELSTCILEPTIYQINGYSDLNKKVGSKNAKNEFIELQNVKKDKKLFNAICRKWNRKMRIRHLFGIEKQFRQKNINTEISNKKADREF